jgi:hypothetical protein
MAGFLMKTTTATVTTKGKTKGDGIMLPILLVDAIDDTRSGTGWPRSAIIWDLVTQGLFLIDPNHPELIVRQSPERLKLLASAVDLFYDHADTRPGVLRGYNVSSTPSCRALVLSVGLDLLNLGDNPSYSQRIRKLIRLGVDRLLRGEVE